MGAAQASSPDEQPRGVGEPAKHGEAISKLSETFLEFEVERQGKLNDRGAAVATTSSALLTLVFAVIALVKPEKFLLENPTSIKLILLSALFFGAAAFTGIALTVGIPVRMMNGEDLANLPKKFWENPDNEMRREIAIATMTMALSYRTANSVKSVLSSLAFVLQTVAIGLLAAALWIELRDLA